MFCHFESGWLLQKLCKLVLIFKVLDIIWNIFSNNFTNVLRSKMLRIRQTLLMMIFHNCMPFLFNFNLRRNKKIASKIVIYILLLYFAAITLFELITDSQRVIKIGNKLITINNYRKCRVRLLFMSSLKYLNSCIFRCISTNSWNNNRMISIFIKN